MDGRERSLTVTPIKKRTHENNIFILVLESLTETTNRSIGNDDFHDMKSVRCLFYCSPTPPIVSSSTMIVLLHHLYFSLKSMREGEKERRRSSHAHALLLYICVEHSKEKRVRATSRESMSRLRLANIT